MMTNDSDPDGRGEPSSISSTLLERVRARRPDAWQRLVDLYGPVVYRWCRQLGVGQADAADVVQDVFAAVAADVSRFAATGRATVLGPGCGRSPGTASTTISACGRASPLPMAAPAPTSDCSTWPRATTNRQRLARWQRNRRRNRGSPAACWSWSAANSRTAHGTPSGGLWSKANRPPRLPPR